MKDLTKAAVRKIEEVRAICAVRAERRVLASHDELVAEIVSLEKKVYGAKQASMITALLEVEVERTEEWYEENKEALEALEESKVSNE